MRSDLEYHTQVTTSGSEISRKCVGLIVKLTRAIVYQEIHSYTSNVSFLKTVKVRKHQLARWRKLKIQAAFTPLGTQPQFTR